MVLLVAPLAHEMVQAVKKQLLFCLQAAKKFVESKKTMSSYGHLANTPFVDEL